MCRQRKYVDSIFQFKTFCKKVFDRQGRWFPNGGRGLVAVFKTLPIRSIFFILWPTEICMQIAGLSLAYLQIEKFIALTKQCLTKHNSSYQPAVITGIWVSQRSSRPRCWDPRFFASACARGISGNFDLQSMPFDKSPDPANCDWSPHPCGLSPSSA